MAYANNPISMAWAPVKKPKAFWLDTKTINPPRTLMINVRVAMNMINDVQNVRGCCIVGCWGG